MSFEEYKNLWVFVETEENEVKPVGYELLNPGRELADKMVLSLLQLLSAVRLKISLRKQSNTVLTKLFSLKATNTLTIQQMHTASL